jgi:hypothetical protein
MRRGVDGRANPRIKSGDGQDGRGSEAARKQPTNKYRYKSRKIIAEIQNTWYDDRHGPKEHRASSSPPVSGEMEVVYNLRRRGAEFFYSNRS